MGRGVRRSGSLSSVTRSKMGSSRLSSMPSMKLTRASETLSSRMRLSISAQ
jgi:hypothetical protein